MRRVWAFLKFFRKDLIIMLLAMRNPATPRLVKGLMLAALLYLISPIDLIPDTIPFFGLLDDAIIVPAAVCGLMNFLPPSVRAESEYRAQQLVRRMPYILLAVSIVIFLWIVLLIWGIYSLLFR